MLINTKYFTGNVNPHNINYIQLKQTDYRDNTWEVQIKFATSELCVLVTKDEKEAHNLFSNLNHQFNSWLEKDLI